jgi:hypothetical protein
VTTNPTTSNATSNVTSSGPPIVAPSFTLSNLDPAALERNLDDKPAPAPAKRPAKAAAKTVTKAAP